jgi:type I pantothenate kinase
VTDAAAAVVDFAARRAPAAGPTVLGLTGSVAAGKSTLAAAIADAARAGGVDVEVVGTDGFLHPNVVLAANELLARKGFPESYDVAALRGFVEALRGGASEVSVPVYSHVAYDILPDEQRVVRAADLVIIEGVNALSALDGRLDVGVYLHADEADLETWYVVRFHELRAEAHDDPTSFYSMFTGMSFDEVDSIARQVWRDVNLVNLRDNIAPCRASADCVVTKGADHAVTDIETREAER